MYRRQHGIRALVTGVWLIVASACADDGSGGDGPEAGDCTEIDETAVRLEIDDESVLPVAQLATGSVADTTATDSVLVLLRHNKPAPADLAYGEEIAIDVALNGLIVGESALSAPDAALSYRLYPPSNTARAPSETDNAAAISGTIDVVAIATEIGESTCGTFVIRAEGTRDVEAVGWFKQPLEAPQPGS